MGGHIGVTVKQVMELLQTIAPIELAEDWDNPGLLCGNPDAPVDKILCALDLTSDVLDEAKKKGVQMIVTHHPILFRGRKNLREDDPEGKLLCTLVRSGIAMAAMHTNYDKVHPGVNDALAARLGLKDIQPVGDWGMCIGSCEPLSLRQWAEHTQRMLGDAVRVYGDDERIIRRVAVMGGAGGDELDTAKMAGADAFVTGEVSYHKAMNAADCGLCVLEAGHAATEKPAISQLSEALQNAANAVQYKVEVFCSAEGLF